MKMNLKKIILAFVASLLGACLFAVSPASSHYTEEKLKNIGYVRQAKNKDLELYYNKENAAFAVRVVKSGYVWYSSPLDWENDEKASGFTKNALPSILSIRAKDKNGSFRPANSYVNVVKRNGLKTKKIQNGIRLNHNFKREGIYIPVDITIDGDSLLISIPISEITEDEESTSELKLLDFEVTPYFGATETSEDGFILVPDGSGAIINFNNNKSEAVYKQYVYGRDKSVIPVRKTTVEEEVALPVFGMSREGAGFIGIIEDSTARGVINAETSGQVTNYNATSASCILRDFDSFTFRERTGTPRDIKVFEKTEFADMQETFSVRYLFLNEEENNVAGMANEYRSYLQKNGKMTTEKNKDEPAMVINFIGTSIKKKPVAGIPMNVDVKFTTYEKAKETIEALQEKGVDNFIVKYDGWIKGGILGKYPSTPNASNSLGGDRELKKFIEWLNEQGIPFYEGADFVNLYTTDLSHMKELTVNHAVNRSPVKVPDYRMSTYTDEKTSDDYPYYIMRATNVAECYKKFMKALDKKYPDIGIAPDSVATVVGSDFGKKGTSRTQAAEILRGLLEESSSTRNIMLSRPFEYALPYTTYITDVPTKSSMYDIENYSVPFYQMVVRGYIPFSNLPANRNTSIEDYKLKLIETGSDISYLWIADKENDVRDSRMQWFINVYRDDWIDEAADLYNEVTKVTSKIKGASIKSYTVDGDKRTTVYSNGVTVSVDYKTKTYSVTKGSAK